MEWSKKHHTLCHAPHIDFPECHTTREVIFWPHTELLVRYLQYCKMLILEWKGLVCWDPGSCRSATGASTCWFHYMVRYFGLVHTPAPAQELQNWLWGRLGVSLLCWPPRCSLKHKSHRWHKQVHRLSTSPLSSHPPELLSGQLRKQKGKTTYNSITYKSRASN
jgi:hypothetical protein